MNPLGEVPPTGDAGPGRAVGNDATAPGPPTTRRRRGRTTPFVGAMATLAAFAGGAVSRGELGVLAAGVVVVLIGMVVVAAIPVIGFTRTMLTLAAEGRRRARGVEDVDRLMSGTASAYQQVLTQFGTLVCGATESRQPDDQTSGPGSSRLSG